VVATAGNASASVAFVAPTNNGGSAITGYTVTSSPGGITATGATSPINVTGLTNGTAYTFRVIATNAIGNSSPSTASSAVTPSAPSFTCGTSTVADIDGNSYNTVPIGSQCWTKENLKVTKYNDGNAIPDETAGGWGGLTTGARSDYTGAASYIATYGYLYNWYAAKGVSTTGSTNYKNICPAGWHVPTDAEWTIMIQTLDPSQAVNSGNVLTFIGLQSPTAGGNMKSTDPAVWNSQNIGANNSSGFSALPGGFRDQGGTFSNVRDFPYFWSATESAVNNGNACLRNLRNGDSFVVRDMKEKIYGFSVRCLKD
jgi:uncharacterized protein (TIGR02145 family)